MTQPAFGSFVQLDEARRHLGASARIDALRRAGARVRESLLSEGPVAALKTLPLVTFPYPSAFAFSGAASSPAPYVMLTNRMNVVQFDTDEGRRTLLFNPSDYERGVAAPFYSQLREAYGEFVSDRLMTTRHGTVQGHLAALGLRPEDVDFIAFDHLHVQDVRRWLGDGSEPGVFPKAKLLVSRSEWAIVQDVHPVQWAWYVPDGAKGVPDERVVLLDSDAHLGRGVALIDTPGHTGGNQSLAVATDRGLVVVSENAVATECFTPEQSRIRGVRAQARHLGLEVVLNGNTRESTLQQYESMLLEKALAGPTADAPEWIGFHPSSELTASLLAPGLSPTMRLAPPEQGQVRAPARSA